MITQELIDSIITKYKAGETKVQIKEDLLNDGYDERDIDDAINHIQKTALMSFPGIAPVVSYVTRFNEYVTKQSVGHSIRVLAGLCVFMLVVSIILYHTFSQYNKGPLHPDSNTQPVYVTATPTVTEGGFGITGLVLAQISGTDAKTVKQGFPNAQISITDQNGTNICASRTDSQGKFTCSAQNPGTFTVTLLKIPNYSISGQSQVTIVEPNSTNSKVSFTIVPIH